MAMANRAPASMNGAAASALLLARDSSGAINAIRNGELFAPASGKLPGSLFHKPVHPSLMTTHASPLVAPCESLRIPSRSGGLHHTRRLLARHFPTKMWEGLARPGAHQ